jgi:hypothetical protein
MTREMAEEEWQDKSLVIPSAIPHSISLAIPPADTIDNHQ